MHLSCAAPTAIPTMKQALPTTGSRTLTIRCNAVPSSNSGPNNSRNSPSFTPISSPKLSTPETASRRNGHSRPATATATTTTVILTEEQAALARKGKVLFEAVHDIATAGGSATAEILPAVVAGGGQVFVCPEESLFYSQAIEKLVLSRPDCPKTLVEFGAGDGSPVISALLKAPPCKDRVINAYEIGASAAQMAANKAFQYGLSEQYVVHNSCFWQGVRDTPADCLIANPPYLPAPDDNILMPALWGGVDGSCVTNDLLSLGFDSCMLLVSAYSNPVLTLQHAKQEGYAVTDFICTPLPFGTYSSEPRVRHWIDQMKGTGEAFFSRSGVYILAAVLFEKQQNGNNDKPDLTEECMQVLTAFQ